MSCVAALIPLTSLCSGLVPFFDACIRVARLPSCCEHNNYTRLGTSLRRGESDRLSVTNQSCQQLSSEEPRVCKWGPTACFTAIKESKLQLLAGFPDDAHRLAYTPSVCSYDTKCTYSSYGLHTARRNFERKLKLLPPLRAQQPSYWEHGAKWVINRTLAGSRVFLTPNIV